MTDSSYKKSLIQWILSLSNSQIWDEAKREWKVDTIAIIPDGEDSQYCLCWQEIRELCELENKKNWNRTIVGNICVNKFLETDINILTIVDAIKRVKQDNQNSLNADSIIYFYEKGVFRSEDKDFYLKIWKKRGLSLKQMKWKKDLNEKVILFFDNRR